MSEALIDFIESCRDLGRGALLAEDLARDGLPGAMETQAALDILDRQLDHILGYVLGHGAA